jgi:hypothetical protein
MFTKEERKERNTSFWADFKKVMRPYKSCNGRRMNWIGYPSDVKSIYIRMEIDQHSARLCFDIQAKDAGVRAILYEQMTELKKVLEATMTWETQWFENFQTKEGQTISRIYWESEPLNFFNDEDWPRIMEFLKDRLIEFDAFYQEFKDILIALAE